MNARTALVHCWLVLSEQTKAGHALARALDEYDRVFERRRRFKLLLERLMERAKGYGAQGDDVWKLLERGKRIDKRFRNRLRTLDDQQKMLRRELRTGKGLRERVVEEVHDYALRKVFVFVQGTSEEVEVRDMTEAERQLGLFKETG